MSLFTKQKERYAEALKTFDPFEDEPLLKLLDPLPPKAERQTENCQVKYWRALITFFVAVGPIIIPCLLLNPTAGGNVSNRGGISRDVGFFGVCLFGVVVLILLILGRRILGDLINELARTGVTTRERFKDFDPRNAARNQWVLRWLERLSRPGWICAGVWWVLALVINMQGYFAFIGEQRECWYISTAQAGSLLYPFHIGSKQPNFAGLWAFSLWSVYLWWIVVLGTRLFVAFACICRTLAEDKGLEIIPSHHDGVGGLMFVGQVSFFLSLLTVVTGIDLAGMTLNEFIFIKTVYPPLYSNVWRLSLMWGIYITLGPLLFFLPLVPLRAKMADAKRRFLHDTHAIYAAADRRLRQHFHEHKLGSESLGEHAALGQLIAAADKMATWPFDRETFLKFAGSIFGPIAPVLFDQAPRVLNWIKGYLHLSQS